MRKVSNPFSNLSEYLTYGSIRQSRNGNNTEVDDPNEELAKATIVPIMEKILTSEERRFVSLVFGLDDGRPHYYTTAVKEMGWTVGAGTANRRMETIRRQLNSYLNGSLQREREFRDSKLPINGVDIVPMSDELRRTPIEQLRLPARINNPLKYCGHTIGALCTNTELDLRYRRGLSPASIEMVKDALKRLDPSLRLAWKETHRPEEIERYDDETRELLQELADRTGVPPGKLWRRVCVGAKALGVHNKHALIALRFEYPTQA